MAQSTREYISQTIKSKMKYYSTLTLQDVSNMTEFALQMLDSGNAKDADHAIYLAFDNEFQGGSV